jgi:Maltokinase N-terminal cap domain
MAVIHDTTMTPGKLDLLSAWLPSQPWYVGTGPELTKAGGFRLDDPLGEVGIEFMVVTDGPVTYHVPLTYRGAPLDGADQALIGTAEHGVLGRRWIYDGVHDPVLLAQLLALLQGGVEPQAQSVTDTPDESVTRHLAGEGLSTLAGPATVVNGPDGTDLLLRTGSAGPLTLQVVRVLSPDRHSDTAQARGHVTAGWRSPDGDERRGPFIVLYEATPTP